jgi:hypothetical protein
MRRGSGIDKSSSGTDILTPSLSPHNDILTASLSPHNDINTSVGGWPRGPWSVSQIHQRSASAWGISRQRVRPGNSNTLCNFLRLCLTVSAASTGGRTHQCLTRLANLAVGQPQPLLRWSERSARSDVLIHMATQVSIVLRDTQRPTLSTSSTLSKGAHNSIFDTSNH